MDGGVDITNNGTLEEDGPGRFVVYGGALSNTGTIAVENGGVFVVSTQNGDNFIAGGGSPAAALGPAITWNKGVALSAGSSAGPLPDVAPANWPIEDSNAWRYFGPTFTYKLGTDRPKGTLIRIK